MKKKRTLTVVAMVLAVLMLGVGYAAINSVDLKIERGSASATPDQGNFVVKFDKNTQVTTKGNGTITAAYDASNELLATFSVTGLTAKGQTASATYTIKNYSPDLIANLAVNNVAAVATGDTEYFTVTATLAENSLEANADTTLVVTVNLIKTPVNDDVSITFPVTVTATAEQPTA